MTPRRRCQPGSGATRSEPVFPTKRKGPARVRRRYAVAVEALVPPDAARVAICIATRVATVYTNAPIRRGEARSSHLCTLLRPHVCPQQRNSATVYTNAPKWHRGAILANLCTLLRCRPGGDATTYPHELTKPRFLCSFEGSLTAWSVCLRSDCPALQTPRSACCEGVGTTGVDGKSYFLRGGHMLLASALSSDVVHLFDGSRPRCLMRLPLAAAEW